MKKIGSEKEKLLTQLIEGLLDLYESETDAKKKEDILDLIRLVYIIYHSLQEQKDSLASKFFKKLLEKFAESGIEELVEAISEIIGGIS